MAGILTSFFLLESFNVGTYWHLQHSVQAVSDTSLLKVGHFVTVD